MSEWTVKYTGGLEAVENPTGGEPLRAGDTVEVDHDTAARLVAQGDWETADGRTPRLSKAAREQIEQTTVQAEEPAPGG